MSGIATAVTPENIKKFVNYISNHPSEPISSNKMADYMNVSKASIHKLWSFIPDKLGGDVAIVPRKGFIWNPPVTLKNTEGYLDPTAEKAIAKVDGTVTGSVMGRGQIWNCQNTSTSGFFLVLSVRDTYCVGLSVFADPELAGKKGNTTGFHIKNSGAMWYVDPARLSSKPKKYMKEFVSEVSSDTVHEIMGTLIDIFGLSELDNAIHADVDTRDDEILSLKNTVLSQEKILASQEDTIDILIENRDKMEKENNDLKERFFAAKHAAKETCVKLEATENECAKLRVSLNEMQKERLVSKGEIDTNTKLYIRELETKVSIYEKLLFGGGKA